jgi:hypothetical protein
MQRSFHYHLARPATSEQGAADIKALPLPPAPCQQATADWLTAEIGYFLLLKLLFWKP